MANEKRLIDANAFAKSTVFVCGGSATDPYYNGYTDALDRVEEVLANFPTADAVEVVHAKAVPIYSNIDDEDTLIRMDSQCPLCSALMLRVDNYCPNCGAKNDGERSGNE